MHILEFCINGTMQQYNFKPNLFYSAMFHKIFLRLLYTATLFLMLFVHNSPSWVTFTIIHPNIHDHVYLWFLFFSNNVIVNNFVPLFC